MRDRGGTLRSARQSVCCRSSIGGRACGIWVSEEISSIRNTPDNGVTRGFAADGPSDSTFK